MPQDQLFKELFQEFFREFLELFYSDVAERLDFERVTFLDKETFTDLLEGSRREADIVAQVYTIEGQPEIVLIHVEIQTQRRKDFPFRMFEYYALLRLRYHQKVFPIAVYLAPGAGGLVEETYREELFGSELIRFMYKAVGLPDLKSEDYLTKPNPLGPTLSALMRPGASGDALRKAMILRQQAIIELNDARRSLLFNIVERYIPLNAEQAETFRSLIENPDFEEVKKMINPYVAQGINQGIIEGTRQSILTLIRLRFSVVPDSIGAKIAKITDKAELDALLEKVLTAPSPEAMGLN